jgi:hypothetical protein
MFITFERHGGFAGMRVAADIDSDKLDPSEAHKLYELIMAADFFNLPPRITVSRLGADQFEYTVTVTHEGKQHPVAVTGVTDSPVLQELLSYLTTLARKGRGAQP